MKYSFPSLGITEIKRQQAVIKIKAKRIVNKSKEDKQSASK